MKQENLSDLEAFFTALADKTRLRLLNLIRKQEICVNSLVTVLGESQPKISRHLAFLRKSGLVETRREGKQVNYYIARFEDKLMANILTNILENLSFQKDLQEDFKKLEEINKTVDFETSLHTSAQTYIHYSRDDREELETFLL